MTNLLQRIGTAVKRSTQNFASFAERATTVFDSDTQALMFRAFRSYAARMGYDLSKFSNDELEQATTNAYALNPKIATDKDECVRAVYRQLAAKGTYRSAIK